MAVARYAWIAIVAVLLAIPSSLPAGNPSCAPVVVTPTHAPVYAPTHYQSAYAYFPAAVFVPTANYSVGLSYPDAVNSQAIKDVAEALKALAAKETTLQDLRLKALEAQIARLQGQPVAPTLIPAQTPEQVAPPAALPKKAVNGAALLKRYCADCHNGKGAGGAYDFDALKPATRAEFIEQIASRKMPKNADIADDVRMDLLRACAGQ